jgi:hypothetical protein
MVKTVSKIIAIFFGLLLILLLVLPFALRGRIVELVKKEINELVDAQVEFGTFRLSLIRNFPHASLRVNDVLVVGINEFENDTLADIGSFMVTIDLRSLLRGDSYEIRSIRLSDPRLLLKVLPDGTANWDIVKFDEPDPERPPEPGDFRLTLQRVEIRNGHLVYHDDYFTTYIQAHDLNAVLRGDLTADLTTLSTRNATIGSFSLRYDNMPVLSRVKVNLTAEMDADLNDFIFTFRENRLVLNELPVRFDGMIGMPGDDVLMDFTFSAPESEFRNFLSLVPAVYAKDFDQLTTSGTLSLEGFVKGAYAEDEIPAFGLELLVSNGMFQYPAMPGSVTNVNIDARINNPGGDIDLTTVDVPVFKANLAGNPVDARLLLRTPVSDPQIDAFLIGMIDLGQVSTFYPLDEGTTLRGVIDSDLEARGLMSSIEAGRFQEFHAAGRLQVRNLAYQSPEFPDGVEIPTADFRFTPQFMELTAFETRLGESDLAATGRIDNILGFLLDDQLLTGQFDARSNFFNLNQFMEETPEDDPDEPMQLSVIKVPENIDFTLSSQFQRILFGDLEINNARGVVRIADQEVVLDNLRMDVLGGSVNLNGSYHTREALPRMQMALDISQLDIQRTFEQFNTVQILAPIAQFASGSYSASFSMNTRLDETLMPVFETLSGRGSLRTRMVQVENVPAMTNLADQLHLDVFRELSLRDLTIGFRFAEGAVEKDPFDIRFGESVATVSGRTYFDQTIDYVMNVRLPRQIFGTQANRVLDNLVSQAAGRGIEVSPGETVGLDVVLGGTFFNPEVRFAMSGMMDDIGDQLRDEAGRLIREAEDRVRDEVDRVRDQVEEEIRTTVDEGRERLQQELDARAEQVMAEANRQAENIRREARNAAETIRREARQQAQRLEDEATGAIAKAAARRAGEALVREADQRAANVETEGDRNAQQLINQAEARAARIRAGEED